MSAATSESLKLIQKLRNEAHRFGITFHRQKRSLSFLNSDLNNIKGVGEKTIQKLQLSFKTIENIKNAKLEDLVKYVNKRQAELVFNYFSEK